MSQLTNEVNKSSPSEPTKLWNLKPSRGVALADMGSDLETVLRSLNKKPLRPQRATWEKALPGHNSRAAQVQIRKATCACLLNTAMANVHRQDSVKGELIVVSGTPLTSTCVLLYLFMLEMLNTQTHICAHTHAVYFLGLK